MSQVLTVPTHFNDIGELSEGFLDRVEQDTLILYGPVPYEDGSEIDFIVLLADGTSAIEGSGRVRAAVDGGAERVPETRYDIVLEALELDGRYEVVFERLVMARQAVSDRPPSEEDAPVTGDVEAAPEAGMEATPEEDEGPTAQMQEISEEEDEATEEAASDEPEGPEEIELAPDEVFSVPPDEVFSVPPSEVEAVEEPSVDSNWEEEPAVELSPDAQATLEAHASSREEPAPVEQAYDEVIASEETIGFEEAFLSPGEEAPEQEVAAEPRVGLPVPKPSMAAPPEAPPAPVGLHFAPPPEGLTRPSRTSGEPEVLFDGAPDYDGPETGLFEYEEGLPIPSRPPLPDLDPSRRVATVESDDVEDVEESEPPEAIDEGYEEVRISELAESAEKG